MDKIAIALTKHSLVDCLDWSDIESSQTAQQTHFLF